MTGLMYQIKVADVSGRIVTGENGERLYRIGNMPVSAGDFVWTDGAAVYGFFTDTDEQKPFVPQVGGAGIPVLTVDALYILSPFDGRVVRRYDIDNVNIQSFVNDGQKAFVQISGAWYDINAVVEIGQTSQIFYDAQITGGALLSLNDDGLYRNLVLTESAITDTTIADTLRDIVLSDARAITDSTISATARAWVPWGARDGAIITRGGLWYQYRSNIRGEGSAHLDVSPTEQNQYTLTIGIDTTTGVEIRRGSITFGTVGYIDNPNMTSVASNGAITYGAEPGAVAISAWQGVAVFGYGYNDSYAPLNRAFVMMYLNRYGYHYAEPTDPTPTVRGPDITFAAKPTAQDYGGDESIAQLAFNAMDAYASSLGESYWLDPGQGPGNYHYYQREGTPPETQDKYPSNDGYYFVRHYDSSGVSYTMHAPGGATLARFGSGVTRATKVFELGNGDLLTVSRNIYRVTGGAAQSEYVSTNSRLAFMPNMEIVVRNLTKIIRAVGGTIERRY